jgi:hypothetical protein
LIVRLACVFPYVHDAWMKITCLAGIEVNLSQPDYRCSKKFEDHVAVLHGMR